MPWDAIDRLMEQFNVARRDLETLVTLDGYGGQGIKYFEEVAQGDIEIGRRAISWSVV